MSLHYQDATVDLYHGDCLNILRDLPDASIDSVVCDPPYGLSNTSPQQVADTVVRWVNGDRDYIPAGSGFMGRPWDAFVPPVAVWDECYRALKPGGHVLAFAGSRTHDLMTLAIRLAGFDIRDSVAWLYGSGFPKSLDVSKAIDKAAPRVGMPAGFAAHLRERRATLGLTQKEIAAHFPSKTGGMTGCVWNWENGANVPTPSQWAVLSDLLDIPPGMWADLIDRVEAERVKTGRHLAGLATGDAGVGGSGDGKDRRDIPATPDAERWQGWGTALKPAFEPVTLARKPLNGTVAANVLAHGTGALNIDGCRVGREEGDRTEYGRGKHLPHANVTASLGAFAEVTPYEPHASGRWPANVVLDETQAAALDEMSGEHDEDGASRYFYVAKADASERVRVDGIAHPTVKPLSIMRWLVRLVTPPGGTVLEPFAGSGTTVEACILEGFNCVAIERETDYLPLIVQRINRRRDPVAAVKGAGEDAGLFDLLGEEIA